MGQGEVVGGGKGRRVGGARGRRVGGARERAGQSMSVFLLMHVFGQVW